MNIPSLFGSKTVVSFEIFPPKRGGMLTNINDTLRELKALEPEYISVTFGAGGSGSKPLTLEVARAIKEDFEIEPLVHLTCINHTKAEIDDLLAQMTEYGLTNILALRGDRNPEIPPKDDFKHASDLIEYIKKKGDFSVSAACYPEGHPECDSLIQDTLNLKKKVDLGAQHLISQLFFDNDIFYAFQERTALAGINVPIDAGIMPVVNKSQIERMVTLCGASLPAKFVRMLNKYEYKPDALKDAGIAYAVDQIIDLISHGVDGIHLYTMNNPEIAERICKSFISLVR